MEQSDPPCLVERGEFYLCLARAFLTPLDPSAHAALSEALGDDLEALAASIGYACDDALADYRRAIAATPDPLALLRHYSRLFVTPPRPVQINAASYLDGAIGGGATSALEDAYRRCGLERAGDFHDLPDHVSAQLEFVAWLYFAQADAEAGMQPMPAVRPEHFLYEFVSRWLPPFLRDLERAGCDGPGDDAPYLHLARVLRAAVEHDAVAPPPSPHARAARAIAKARHDRATRGITADDIAFIAERLRAKGLSTDHLAIPPDLRDEARGYVRAEPPSPRRGSRYE